MFMIDNPGDFIFYLIFYLFWLVVVFQYIRVRTARRLIGLMIITVITALYTLAKILVPHSPFTPNYIPPIGFVGSVYYLAYPQKRNRVVAVIAILFIVALIGAYFISSFGVN